MTQHSQFSFLLPSNEAVVAIDSIAAGRGWCNVTPHVQDDVGQLTPNVFQLLIKKGAPVATLVTAAPKKGVPQESSLGVLHTRGKLSQERLSMILGDATFKVRQNHNQRGLLLNVPWDTSASEILRVMCTATDLLCDYERKDDWEMDLFVRD